MRFFNSWVTRPITVTFLATCLTACDFAPKEWKTPNMTPLSPRLESLFHKTKTICFGRFVIDLPTSSHIAWGSSSAPLDVIVYKNMGSQMDQRVVERENVLKAEERYPLTKGLSLYFETLPGPVKGQKTIISQQNFDSTGLLRMESYFQMKNHLVELNALPLEENKERALSKLNDMASRLRPREADEVPNEPGTCVDGAFMTDSPTSAKHPSEGEVMRIGFSLIEFPDVNLSILLLPGRTLPSEENTLKYQLEKLKKGPVDSYVKSIYLRKAERIIHEWTDGFEALTYTKGAQTADEIMHPHHEFFMDFQGETGNVFRPYADIRMETGVANNKIGATKASLTDAEAIALWDKLTGSIRVRPVTTAPKPVSQAGPVPLGTLAATGRVCPQTGWWECTEGDTVQGGRRQFFRAGERMSEAVLLYAPTLRQRLQGVVPSHRTVTAWKLVETDGAAGG